MHCSKAALGPAPAGARRRVRNDFLKTALHFHVCLACALNACRITEKLVCTMEGFGGRIQSVGTAPGVRRQFVDGDDTHHAATEHITRLHM
jgi:hypothetical protein